MIVIRLNHEVEEVQSVVDTNIALDQRLPRSKYMPEVIVQVNILDLRIKGVANQRTLYHLGDPVEQTNFDVFDPLFATTSPARNCFDSHNSLGLLNGV